MSWSRVCCRALTQQNKQQHVRPFYQQSVQHCDVFEFSSPGRNLQTTKKKRSEARSRKVGIVEVHSTENGKQTPHTLFEITSRSFNLFLEYFFPLWLWSPRMLFLFLVILSSFYENHKIQSNHSINYLQTLVALNSSYPIWCVCLQDSAIRSDEPLGSRTEVAAMRYCA